MTAPTPNAPAATEIKDGIEWFSIGDDRDDCQCARCGSSAGWLSCPNCDEDGYSSHDCGEDCCCCVDPEPNVLCDWCNGSGGSWHCISSPAFCNANPMPGREHITSTAMNPEAWND